MAPATMELVVWTGQAPKQCCLCEAKIQKVFVDGRTLMGRWGPMCLICFEEYGTGLGIGCGQRFELRGDTFIKTAG